MLFQVTAHSPLRSRYSTKSGRVCRTLPSTHEVINLPDSLFIPQFLSFIIVSSPTSVLPSFTLFLAYFLHIEKVGS
jgi:hypothetical protein